MINVIRYPDPPPETTIIRNPHLRVFQIRMPRTTIMRLFATEEAAVTWALQYCPADQEIFVRTTEGEVIRQIQRQ